MKTKVLKSDFEEVVRVITTFLQRQKYEKQEYTIYIITVFEVRLEQSIWIHLYIAPKLIIIYVNEHKFVCFINCTLHVSLAEEEA